MPVGGGRPQFPIRCQSIRKQAFDDFDAAALGAVKSANALAGPRELPARERLSTEGREASAAGRRKDFNAVWWKVDHLRVLDLAQGEIHALGAQMVDVREGKVRLSAARRAVREEEPTALFMVGAALGSIVSEARRHGMSMPGIAQGEEIYARMFEAERADRESRLSRQRSRAGADRER